MSVSPARLHDIQRLRDANYTHAEIALALGITRRIVQAALEGHECGSRIKLPPLTGHHRRCPGCGNRVLMPCLQCQILRKEAS